ncbi:MAG: PHP domain-containing protein [Chitinispirillaceae bacterium]|nr:PHP domain-containing protein [Chitinispirillaceae bacterium]
MNTNLHVHTPYSFSPFGSTEELVKCAKEQNIVALGINDFNTVEGYNSFAESCFRHKIYPIFNIEFMVCQDEIGICNYKDTEANSERYYILGKALSNPVTFSKDSSNLMASLWKSSQDRIWKIIDSLNNYFKNIKLSLELDYNQIRCNYNTNTVHHYHICKEIYNRLRDKNKSKDQFLQTLRKLFNDSSFDVDPLDDPTVENEIYKRLIVGNKIGSVYEELSSFIDFFQAKQIILQAKGIPAYQFPCVNSDKRFSIELSGLAKKLFSRGVYVIEFNTSKMETKILDEYMNYFFNNNFCVVVTNSHSNPFKKDLLPLTKEGEPLPERLLEIAYKGACILAAHQELHYQKKGGFIDERGNLLVKLEERDKFIAIGDSAIKKVWGR